MAEEGLMGCKASQGRDGRGGREVIDKGGKGDGSEKRETWLGRNGKQQRGSVGLNEAPSS